MTEYNLDIDLTQPILINTFGFNIPCREFIISAQITKDRRMPVVDEFVLRILNTIEQISISRLARFFGFDGHDLGVVLNDLRARSLVTITGDNVELHQSARELFRTSTDSTPTLTVVDEFHAKVWFDLISQSMIASRGLHSARNLITLTPIPARMDIEANFAREAFDANFKDYLRKFRKIKNPEQWSLYSILDVQPGRFSHAQIAGSEYLTLTSTPKLETTLTTIEGDRPGKLRQLTDAMSYELRKLDRPAATVAARKEYSRLVSIDSLEKATSQDGYLDLHKWLDIESGLCDSQNRPFIGYPYLDHNRKALLELISNSDIPKANETQEPSFFWLRPGGSSWGATEDLNYLLGDLRALVRRWSGSTQSLSTSLLLPASLKTKSAKAFNRIFDNGLYINPGRQTNSVEILAMKDFFAMVTVMAPLSDSVSIPVGRMTTSKPLIDQIIKRSHLEKLQNEESTTAWTRESRKRDNYKENST